MEAHSAGVVNQIGTLTIRPVNDKMIALPSFLAFLLPFPAVRAHEQPSPHRRRAVRDLALSRHVLRDAGLEEFENPGNDPRWMQRPDLER